MPFGLLPAMSVCGCMQPEKISVPVQCHNGEDDKMEGLADPKVSPKPGPTLASASSMPASKLMPLQPD